MRRGATYFHISKTRGNTENSEERVRPLDKRARNASRRSYKFVGLANSVTKAKLHFKLRVVSLLQIQYKDSSNKSIHFTSCLRNEHL